MSFLNRLGARGRYYASGVLAGSTGKGLTWALGLAQLALLTRILGSAQFGTYAFVLAVTTLLAPLASGGLNHLVLYRIAETSGDDGALAGGGLVIWCLYRVVAISVALTICVALGVQLSGVSFGHATFAFWMTVAVASLPFQAVNQVFSFWYRANLRVKAASLMPLLRTSVYVGALTAIWLSPVEHLPIGSAPLVAIAFLVAAIVSTLIWIARTPRTCFAASTPPPAGDHAYALRTMANRTVQQGIERIDVVMVGILLGSTVTANYAVAARLARLVSMGNRILAPVVAPRLRRTFTRGEYSLLEEEYDTTRLFSLTAALLCTAVLVGAGEPVLGLIGPYSSAWPILVLLCLAHIVPICFGPNGRYLKMAGLPNLLLLTTIISGVLNVTLNLFLIPAFGLYGAATATFGALFLANSIISIIIWRLNNFDTVGYRFYTVLGAAGGCLAMTAFHLIPPMLGAAGILTLGVFVGLALLQKVVRVLGPSTPSQADGAEEAAFRDNV